MSTTLMSMSITTVENMKDFNYRDKYPDFDEIEDIEVLAMQPTWCMIRTGKLMPTLWFMQQAWRHIWELTPDDEYISWVRFEKNILTYYKKF